MASPSVGAMKVVPQLHVEAQVSDEKHLELGHVACFRRPQFSVASNDPLRAYNCVPVPSTASTVLRYGTANAESYCQVN
jgi:hypothetical protein